MVDSDRPFSFEMSIDTRDLYPSLRHPTKSWLGVSDDQLFVGFALLGAACLLWRYTIALGAGIIAVTTFGWAMRERARKWRAGYERIVEPSEIVRVGATESGYWVRGEGFFAESRWDRIINAVELNGYLIVQSRRMPRVQFPTEELKKAGVYDRIRTVVDAPTARYKEALMRVRAESGA